VERALILVATGTLTVAMAHASKGKMVILSWTLNLSISKESMHQTGFSDIAWSKAIHDYTKSACSLTNTKFSAVIQGAWKFMKPIWAHNKTTEPIKIIDIDNDNDEWACLVDNSDSEVDYRLSSLFQGLINIDCLESINVACCPTPSWVSLLTVLRNSCPVFTFLCTVTYPMHYCLPYALLPTLCTITYHHHA
jgi:hypothetical protein